MKCNFEKFSNLHKCNFTFSLQMMMISGSHNTKQTFFLRIPNTFANHYPSSFFSFYLKEHYYTVHGIGEAKEKMGQNLWGETRRRGGGDQSVENSQFMGWTTGLESTQKLGEKGIDLTRVKGQTAVSKEVVDNMFRFYVR